MNTALLVAGIALLCLSAVGAIFSQRRWLRLVCTLYLTCCAVAVAVLVVRGRWNSSMLIVSILLILLGLYAQGAHHTFAARFKGNR